jgi:hypothetical protein
MQMEDVVEVEVVGVGLVEDYQVLLLHFLIQLMLNEDMDRHDAKTIMKFIFRTFLIKK